MVILWFVVFTVTLSLDIMLLQDHFWNHFSARAAGLIVLPFIIYLSFFWVHFALLPTSGPGDTFMSPAFQETLAGNEMLMNSQGS